MIVYSPTGNSLMVSDEIAKNLDLRANQHITDEQALAIAHANLFNVQCKADEMSRTLHTYKNHEGRCSVCGRDKDLPCHE